jgi:hypothetical protein
VPTGIFAYDFKEMRIGKAIDHSHDACVIPRDMPRPRRNRLAYVLGVAVPVAVMLGASLTAKKPAADKKTAGSRTSGTRGPEGQ